MKKKMSVCLVIKCSQSLTLQKESDGNINENYSDKQTGIRKETEFLFIYL